MDCMSKKASLNRRTYVPKIAMLLFPFGVITLILLLGVVRANRQISVLLPAMQDGTQDMLYCMMAGTVRVIGKGQKRTTCTDSWHFHSEFEYCLVCNEKLKPHEHLNWRKAIQLLSKNVYVTSRGRYCPNHTKMTYLSAEASQLSLPEMTYGIDVLVRIGYQREYQKMTWKEVKENLPDHIRVSRRHLSNLYQRYKVLLASAERLDIDALKAAAAEFGGLIISVDGLQPEGGQPQLWVVREVLTGSILAAGWLPRVDETTIQEFLRPVKALDLPILAIVSDKQASLINALTIVWPDIPNQYCQAHFLSNAVTPIYEADEHMKTQLRKQVRAKVGETMRQVQAEVKRKRDQKSGQSSLIVTGLAAQPPDGLDEIKAIAKAAREAHSRGETFSLEEFNTPVVSTQSEIAPRTVEEVREALKGSNVIIYERHSKREPATSAEASEPDRQQVTDELVEKYAARLRRVLSRTGRKPFRLAGLRLYVDLLTLQASLEVSLTHLPNEVRLLRFADALRDTLLEFEDDYAWIAESYSWILDISKILDLPLLKPGQKPVDVLFLEIEGQAEKPLSSITKADLDAYLERLEQRNNLNDKLLKIRGHIQRLTKRYAPGLFHCYDIPGLPRTNNDLESTFGRVRRQTLLTSGPYHAQQRLHEEGAWLLFDTVHNEHEQVERLQRVPLDEWQAERRRMQKHKASFTEDRRFRRQSSKYLMELEEQAAKIAKL